MNKEQELTTQLAQAIEDQAKTADTFAATIDELKKQIAEEQKPEFKVGDYGFSGMSCFPRIVLCDGKLAHRTDIFNSNKANDPTVIYGNIFDDLKDMQEDVTGFTVEDKEYTSKYIVRLGCLKEDGSSGPFGNTDKTIVWIQTTKDGDTGEYGWLGVKAFKEYVRKLKQMEATIDRKQAK